MANHFDTVVRSGAVREGLIDHRAGTTHLDADLSSFSGDTQVNGGTLLVNDTLGSQRVTVASGAVLGGDGTIVGDVFAQPGAVVNPGNSPGVLNIEGDLVLQDGAVLVMEIAGSTAGAQHDRLNVGGDFTFSMGTLELVFLGGYAPAAGQQFELFDVGGRFAGAPQIEVIGLLPGWLFETHFDDGTGRFSLMSLSDGFSAAPVPMPASSALFAAGLAVLGWRLRSRRGGVAAPLAVALARGRRGEAAHRHRGGGHRRSAAVDLEQAAGGVIGTIQRVAAAAAADGQALRKPDSAVVCEHLALVHRPDAQPPGLHRAACLALDVQRALPVVVGADADIVGDVQAARVAGPSERLGLGGARPLEAPGHGQAPEQVPGPADPVARGSSR